MIGSIEARLRRIRRKLSRSVWLSRLLQLPVSEGSPTRPGMILLQIDGLSQPQFERALARKELPFLARLMRREHYRLHAHYSGLPSTTPAVQAELFYGVKGAVPAFSFRDHQTGQVVRMFEPDAAARVEAHCAAIGDEALLNGGSTYSDNYTGGAAESHFCPSSMGWGPALRGANPLVLLAFVAVNFYSILRIAVLLFLELGLALVDFARGLVRGHDFLKELKFIPTRVAISIILRELCVIGGKIDISRGLPVIHINFLGYDEQAHRRGPRSLFAHWTLKGIDDAIARLWHAASHSAWRHYEVWIYSDHGQAHVRAYQEILGYSLEEAVGRTFARLNDIGVASTRHAGGVQTQRVRLLGGNRIQRLFAVFGVSGEEVHEQGVVVAALGPVGHVYSPRKLEEEEREHVALELARTHKVPVVLTLAGPGLLRAWTEAGEYDLPGDCAGLFGAQHPFLDAIGEDLVRLCEHADAGDFVLLGWREGLAPLTFASENGAHAGLTPEETNGFALLPGDAPLPVHEPAYVRPIDLRDAALRHLGRSGRKSTSARKRAISARTDTLRVMTYNVHSCIGMDGKIDAERIARVIARARPDVVALQELDVGRVRSFGVDQAHQIARYLEMEFHFHPAVHLEKERYGDAILTHLPQHLVKVGSLPGLADKPRLEPRGALWVALDLHGQEVQVINTHLGLSPRERMAQVEALLGSDWLGNEQCRDPVILCGDFNAQPTSLVCRRVGERFQDVQVLAQGHRPRCTFTSRFPTVRIDHIFVSPGLEVNGIEIPRWQLAHIASDHLPLVAELRIRARAGSEPRH
jgi:endonuclease/exonuclease/phosphatase family metal-dependent hydrolase